MRKPLFSSIFLHIVMLLSVFTFACNCGSTRLQGVKNTSASVLAPPPNKVADNRDLMEYFTVRSVKVVRDCTVRDKAAVVGMTRKAANKAYDGGGTGVIIHSSAGKSSILTAYHVVEKKWPKALICNTYVIPKKSLHGGKRLSTKLIARDKKKDIAYLLVDKDLKVSTKFETDPYLGMPVYAAGYTGLPAVGSQKKLSITSGLLATLSLSAGEDEEGKIHRVTSQIYFGNSGGGVWSAEGKLVGIAILLVGAPAGDYPTVPYEGSYYIKPANELYNVANHNKHTREQILGKN
jgi:S1-C subfamily serine protease